MIGAEGDQLLTARRPLSRCRDAFSNTAIDERGFLNSVREPAVDAGIIGWGRSFRTVCV